MYCQDLQTAYNTINENNVIIAGDTNVRVENIPVLDVFGNIESMTKVES